jgi:uncharacterized 2Fe-2S/4Fe-4S cluster protein (DUF4445 family)
MSEISLNATTPLPNGWVRTLALIPPCLNDNTADLDRLLNALQKDLKSDRIKVDLDLMRKIPFYLREWNYQVTCVLFKDDAQWLLVHISNPADPSPLLGLAVDLGTTRVVLRLLNLVTGKILAKAAFDNPQIAVGPDILARIHSAGDQDGFDLLATLIRTAMDQNIIKLCRSNGYQSEDIHLMTMAGNTAMTHLFLGLNPRWIIREPYIPVVNRPGIFRACKLGLQSVGEARILIFPNVGSYFGGDLIAGILLAELHRQEDVSILVDVGTNAEVVLGNRDWLVGCAGAAGPALEGGVTHIGMLAGPGVIDRIHIDPKSLRFDIDTILGLPPKGICGSGMIDLAAQLFLAGMIDIRGKLLPEKCKEHYKEKDGLAQLIVVPADQSATLKDLCISQADIDSLIRSKAAMYTILETLTQSVGVDLNELPCFYVAGTFGSFIDPRSAITIGMIPDLPLDHYRTLGNSSLGGCTKVLMEVDAMDAIDRIRDRITYMELNVNQEFMNRFSAAKFLPHTDTDRFPSVTKQFNS